MINIIALTTMLIDHIGSIFFPEIIIFRIIGRISFPLFALGIAEGYKRTKNFNCYAIRLFLIAIVSQIPFNLVFSNEQLNVCFTLFISLLALKIYDSKIFNILKFGLILSFMVSAHVLNLQYSFYGILTVILFYIFNNTDKIVYYQFILTIISIIIIKYDPIQLFSVLSSIIVLIIHLYKNDDFKINKVFRYCFYPGHLFILFILKEVIYL